MKSVLFYYGSLRKEILRAITRIIKSYEEEYLKRPNKIKINKDELYFLLNHNEFKLIGEIKTIFGLEIDDNPKNEEGEVKVYYKEENLK